MKNLKKGNSYGLILTIPALLGIAIFIALPLVRSILLSFNSLYLLEGMDSGKYIGFKNYVKFFNDPNLFLFLKNTIIWVFGSVFGPGILGMILGLLLNRRIKARPLWRGLALIPWVMPPVVVGMIWRWILDGQWGILNRLLQQIHIIDKPILWLADTSYVMLSIVQVAIWKFFPFWFVNILAGLQVIPQEMYEAAIIDGASSFNVFTKITLPQLRPILFVLVLLQTIWSFNEFTIIWVLTQGGPGNTSMTLAPLVYVNSFKYYRMGYGASIGVVIMIITMIFTAIYLKREKINS
ncbi:carbohydrate ABC transporter permease [Atribacter laminatus]|nr:sugar ABC transporter permease [Atribacter laminatus]